MTKTNRERAIFYLEDYAATYRHRLSAEVQEIYNMTIEALEKQIPKKPIYGYDDMDYIKCPYCKEPIGAMDSIFNGSKFCEWCGQAIDWGDSE